jgi:hypothetical protein
MRRLLFRSIGLKRLAVSIEDIKNSVEIDRNAKVPAVNNQCQDNDRDAATHRDRGDREQGSISSHDLIWGKLSVWISWHRIT